MPELAAMLDKEYVKIRDQIAMQTLQKSKYLVWGGISEATMLTMLSRS
jgi:hypothetical protein